MYGKYLSDYYKSKIGVAEICKSVGVTTTTFNRWLKRNGMLNRTQWYAQINTGIKELDAVLRIRYSSMFNRCKGKTTDHYGHYAGKEYPHIYEWVEFCNNHKEELLNMWNEFVANNKSMKYSISVDRINDEGGYTLDNIQFTTHGFNSWKRNLYPVKVIFDNTERFFMSCEEASRFYGIRTRSINECLNHKPHCRKEYTATSSTVNEVLNYSHTKNIAEYYEKFIK